MLFRYKLSRLYLNVTYFNMNICWGLEGLLLRTMYIFMDRSQACNSYVNVFASSFLIFRLYIFILT